MCSVCIESVAFSSTITSSKHKKSAMYFFCKMLPQNEISNTFSFSNGISFSSSKIARASWWTASRKPHPN